MRRTMGMTVAVLLTALDHGARRGRGGGGGEAGNGAAHGHRRL